MDEDARVEFEAESRDEPRIILGVPGVGAGLLSRSSVEWLLQPELEVGPDTQFAVGLRRWLDEPLPGKYFGVMAVADAELAWFKLLIQRAGWTYGAPPDIQELQLALARSA